MDEGVGFLLRRLRAKDLTSDCLGFFTCKAGVIEIPALGLLAHKMAGRMPMRHAGHPMSTCVFYQKKPEFLIENEPSAQIESQNKDGYTFSFLNSFGGYASKNTSFP